MLNLCTATSVMRSAEALAGAALAVPDEAQIAVRQRTDTGEKDFSVDLDWHIDAYDKITAARFGILVQVKEKKTQEKTQEKKKKNKEKQEKKKKGKEVHTKKKGKK